MQAQPVSLELVYQDTPGSQNDERPDPATTLTELAEHYRAMGDLERAELLYTKALEIRERSHGSKHPLAAKARQSLAKVRAAQDARRQP